jgi:hypothetical protein
LPILRLAGKASIRRRPVNSALGITLNPARSARLPSLLAILLVASVPASAKCMLPAPDGSEEQTTSPNLEGTVAGVNGLEIVVRQARNGKLVAVRLPEELQIYTAFGGRARIGDLRTRQAVSIWFEGCIRPTRGVAPVAYLQIYSLDPGDKPEQRQKKPRTPE